MSSTVLAVSGTILAAIIFFVWLVRRERKAGRMSAHFRGVERSLEVEREKELELQKLDKEYDDKVHKYFSDRSLDDRPWFLRDKDDS